MMRCPKCGKEISEDANFCSFCGTRIEGCITESIVQEDNTEEYEKEKLRYSDEINKLADNYNVPESVKLNASQSTKSLYF